MPAGGRVLASVDSRHLFPDERQRLADALDAVFRGESGPSTAQLEDRYADSSRTRGPKRTQERGSERVR